jgi:hypothetical protein
MRYDITTRAGGQYLGAYDGATEDDAVEALARDAGYHDTAHEAQVLETTPEALRADLIVVSA